MIEQAPAVPTSPLRRLAAAVSSERVVVFAIVANALALFVMASVEEEGRAFALAHRIDLLCVLYFAVEAASKIGCSGWGGYFRNGWNRFDFALLALSSPVLLLPAMDTQPFAAVLLLRLGRLFRLFRLMRFIPNRDHLLAGVQRSLRAAVGVVLALMLLNFVLAMGATFLFGKLAPEHFGNPFLSVYTMFRVFTIEGWPDLPALLVERAAHPVWGVVARVYFALSVLLGGIMGLSLANAVFVDEMTADNNSALEAKVDALHAELRSLRAALGLGPPPVPGGDGPATPTSGRDPAD